MSWTYDIPSRSGFYWYRRTEESSPYVVAISVDSRGVRSLKPLSGSSSKLAHRMPGQFFGPIRDVPPELEPDALF